VPNPVVSGECVELVNDHGSEVGILAHLVCARSDEHAFQALGRRQQATRWIGSYLLLFRFGNVPMPACSLMADELEIAAQSSFLVVDKGLQRTQVDDRQRMPVFAQHPTHEREEGRLGLAAGRLCLDDDVLAPKNRLNARLLHLTQPRPADAVDDVILESWIEAFE
jgi:hypothetical protein